MTSKQKYIQFCETRENIPLFYRPTWLDAATSGQWNVLLSVNKANEIVAFMPVCQKKKFGFSAIYTPFLTPYSGIWFCEPVTGDKSVSINANKRHIIQDLMSQLPDCDYFLVNFHYSFDIWLPFFHQNYKQTTRYTYLLHHIKNSEKIWDGFKSSLKNKIKKAEKEYKVSETDNTELIYTLCKANFTKQQINFPFDISYLNAIDKTIPEGRKIFIVRDQQDKIVAAQYLVWDNISACNLMLALDEDHKKMGVGPLVLWHSIRFASTVTDTYDFEGSMLQGVQPFFESFGGSPTPYYQIYRIKNPFMRMWYALTGKL